MIFRIIFAALSGYLAHKRGRNPYAWIAIGFLLLIFAPLLLLILPDLTEQQPKEPVKQSEPEGDVIDITPKAPPAGGLEGKEWYYATGERQQVGPVSFDELKGAFRRGKLNAETLVWCEGMGDWKRVREYPELANLL